MEAKESLRNMRAQLRRGMKTLVKKARKLTKVHDMDIAIIMRKNGQYYTYSSTDEKSWPPTMEQIVSQYSSLGSLLLD
jgi:hypothetical protein